MQVLVGREDQSDEALGDNIFTLYNLVVRNLPKESHNIKNMYLKMTMSPAVKID